jgi:hypothetical protein
VTDEQRVEIIRAANHILNGFDLMLGCRFLQRALAAADLRDDPDAQVICAVESDSDNYPDDSLRELWHPATWAEKAAQRERYVASARDGVFEASRALLRKLATACTS